MDFWEVVELRHCVRSFDAGREVTDALVAKLLDAARHAPSAGGIYPTEFVVVRDVAVKTQLAAAARNQEFLADAPVVIVVVSDAGMSAAKYGERGRNLYAVQDAAAATENLFLAATASGLGACWVGAFEESEVAKVLQLDEAKRPLAIIPVGYPR
ncbi:MAG: nitroreductase family protein [Patescibacteria group bacterium]|nr:nitroreductase family protein [Patescibacteria group bacterium]